jgi:hypothetical protein
MPNYKVLCLRNNNVATVLILWLKSDKFHAEVHCTLLSTHSTSTRKVLLILISAETSAVLSLFVISFSPSMQVLG